LISNRYFVDAIKPGSRHYQNMRPGVYLFPLFYGISIAIPKMQWNEFRYRQFSFEIAIMKFLRHRNLN